MKKLIALFIALAGIITLSACSNQEQQEDNNVQNLLSKDITDDGEKTAIERAVECDLSTDGAVDVRVTLENGEYIIPIGFYTNSEEILIENSCSESVTISLYSFGDVIRQMKLDGNETKKFDGLNYNFPYKIGVNAENVIQFDLLISDNHNFETNSLYDDETTPLTRVYMYDDCDELMKPAITLNVQEGTFSFFFSAVSSYYATGLYVMEDDVLILNTNDGDFIYVFDMVGETLVFDAEKSSKTLWYADIPDGAIFD